MNVPDIDRRTKRDIIEKISELARSYLPEWRFTEENPDIGSVIAMIFADMFEGTVKRYNNVLYKHHIAFLNNLDIAIKPSVPAKGVVCFEQSADFITGVYVPSKTKLIAGTGGAGGSVIFETQRSVFVTPAKISGIIYHSPANDSIAVAYGGNEDITAKRISLFDINCGENIQKHFFAFCHRFVLNVNGSCGIRLAFQHSEGGIGNKLMECISDSRRMRWLYYCSGEWKPFDYAGIEEDFIVLKGDNVSIAEEEYEGYRSCWIGCEAVGMKDMEPLGIKSLRIKTLKEDISPEVIYADDTEQAIEKFQPFGEELSLYRECYIACREAFSKANAKVTLCFTLSYTELEKEFILPVPPVEWKLIMKKPEEAYYIEKLPVVCDRVIWEYWNGLGWARLDLDGGAETVFNNSRSGEIKLSFRCPESIRAIPVNAYDTHWIRMRLVSSKNIFQTNCRHYAPVISGLRIEYCYEGSGLLPERALAWNNTVNQDITQSLASGSGAVLFRGGQGKNVLYIGFDRYPEGSPISIYFNIDGKSASDGKSSGETGGVPVLEWEYYSSAGKWKEFKLSDTTGGFSDPGIVTLIIPEDFADTEIFGRKCFWLRITDADNENVSSRRVPSVQGIYINSVEVLNEETMEEEIFFVEEKKPGFSIRLSRKNIISLKVMVNEQGASLSPSSDEYLDAVRRHDIEIKKDSQGNVSGVWRAWDEVDSFIGSRPGDRHYIVDRITGEILFGDGKKGMIPQKRYDEAIRVLYSSGGGKSGNLSPGSIDRMADAMRFIGRVYNPASTHGGSNCEDVDAAVRRGANILKHGGRAVTEEDFEALAMEASRSIARVKCVSNINREGVFSPGQVTVAVLMEEFDNCHSAFLAQKESIESFLRDKASCTLCNGRIRVVKPVFLKVSAKLWFKVKTAENIYEIQRRVKEKIMGFIDPVKGNFNNCGWNIGELPNRAQIFSYVKSMDIEGSIERLILTVSDAEDAAGVETHMADLAYNPFYMGINGQHEVTVIYG
ncbi:putative phage baseplate assembly protein [Anaerobacterium chartisolvens]|uniref:Putative phage baseplate assembly protein n=1 Tax=Anaerobacterium chartisolvens TaxID=1297424 RepID=A0A369AQA6_9FIRM|nr:hypothetical protein [Anaerobacterium chartisolvens]RCX11371.1 putative phage baseplate assembly protein [Anaerobacterium chartisolvens]